MLDYQRIVDEVRTTFDANSNGLEAIDLVRASAADYAVACDEVNARLQQCGTYLKKGFRSEAIQLCEVEPNLLETVATLDFPERAAWQGMLGRLGIASPSRLLMDVAAELNEAYAIEQPLAALLQRHRLLAFARAALPLRIQVLRRLAEVDPNNPVWQEDLQTFQAERCRQIQEEALAAAGAGDTAALAALEAELRGDGWLESPPPALVKWLVATRGKFAQAQARKELECIELELSQAFSGLDPEQGRRLRTRWQSVLAGL